MVKLRQTRESGVTSMVASRQTGKLGETSLIVSGQNSGVTFVRQRVAGLQEAGLLDWSELWNRLMD